eukprot:2726226-Amphidinium_carterae.1
MPHVVLPLRVASSLVPFLSTGISVGVCACKGVLFMRVALLATVTLMCSSWVACTPALPCHDVDNVSSPRHARKSIAIGTMP